MIEPWSKGEPITARKLNEAIGQGNRLDAQARFGRPAMYANVPNAVPIKCTVVSVHDDHLICRLPNQQNNSADFPVAKPWKLRRTTYDGVTRPWIDGTLRTWTYVDEQSRTQQNVSTGDTEGQVIVERYVWGMTIGSTDYVGDELTVQRVAGGTGVTYTDSATGYVVTVDFEDVNRDGRAWSLDNE